MPSRKRNSRSTHMEEGPCSQCPPKSAGKIIFRPTNFDGHWSDCSATQTAISKDRLASLIFLVSFGESEERPSGKDLELRGGCPECSEWRERDQVDAEGTICTISKNPCRTRSNKSRTAEKSSSNAGSKYANSKNTEECPSCCRILKASLTSASKGSVGREQERASLTTFGLHNGSNRGETGMGEGFAGTFSVKADEEVQWIFEVRHLQSS